MDRHIPSNPPVGYLESYGTSVPHSVVGTAISSLGEYLPPEPHDYPVPSVEGHVGHSHSDTTWNVFIVDIPSRPSEIDSTTPHPSENSRSSVKQHKCDFPGCGKDFARPYDVNRHKALKHQKKERLSCPFDTKCRIQSHPRYGATQRWDHILSHCGYMYPCFDCGKPFKSRSDVTKHCKGSQTSGYKCTSRKPSKDEKEEQLKVKNRLYQAHRAALLKEDAWPTELPEVLPEYLEFMKKSAKRHRSWSPSEQAPLSIPSQSGIRSPQPVAGPSRSTRTRHRVNPYSVPAQPAIGAPRLTPTNQPVNPYPVPLPESAVSHLREASSTGFALAQTSWCISSSGNTFGGPDFNQVRPAFDAATSGASGHRPAASSSCSDLPTLVGRDFIPNTFNPYVDLNWLVMIQYTIEFLAATSPTELSPRFPSLLGYMQPAASQDPEPYVWQQFLQRQDTSHGLEGYSAPSEFPWWQQYSESRYFL